MQQDRLNNLVATAITAGCSGHAKDNSASYGRSPTVCIGAAKEDHMCEPLELRVTSARSVDISITLISESCFRHTNLLI